MSLYPTLEDMKVDHMAQSQAQVATRAHHDVQAIASAPPPQSFGGPASLYPALGDYMGLDLSQALTLPAVAPSQQQLVAQSGSSVVAPVTGAHNLGVARAEIKQGVRQVVLCKDADGKMGLRVRSVNKGVFVALVHKDSPAAMVGLRFGDQLLEIDSQLCAGWDTAKVMKALSNCPINGIRMAVRDRPFERIITLTKDSTGHAGFLFKNGAVTAIVKDSSAARNGLLTEHHLIEVNGRNVVGLKDSLLGELIAEATHTVTLTIMPSFVYEHIMKCMGSSLVKKFMDHSIPDL